MLIFLEVINFIAIKTGTTNSTIRWPRLWFDQSYFDYGQTKFHSGINFIVAESKSDKTKALWKEVRTFWMWLSRFVHSHTSKISCPFPCITIFAIVFEPFGCKRSCGSTVNGMWTELIEMWILIIVKSSPLEKWQFALL